MASLAMIDRDALAIYLNDHLAGSVAALRMMDRVSSFHGPSAIGETFRTLRRGVEADQAVLHDLLARIEAPESVIAKAAGWMGERVSRLKLGVDRADDSGVMLFEAIEALTLGFHGRHALWNLLATLEGDLRSGHDFGRLGRETAAQITLLEQMRLDVGAGALTTPGSGGSA
jgi:hypothetical protein